MKKLILLSFLFSIFTILLYSQPASQIVNDNIPFTKGTEGILGAQCVGGLVYDDNTFENGLGWNAGYGIGKYAMKITPGVYPYTINQVCIALTRTSAGSANWTFDVIVYDATGTGGGPGNLIATIPNQTATNVPLWPTVSWFDFTGITTIPALNSGSYYVGLSWDPAAMPNHYIGSDESVATPVQSGYGYIQGNWSPIAGAYRALGVRVDGTGPTLAHNIAVGPFLGLQSFFNVGTQKVIKAKISNIGSSNETGIPIKFFINGVQSGSLNLNLNAGAVDSVSFNWTPTDTGTKNIRIVSGLSNDEFRSNDTVSANVVVYSPGYFQTCYGTGSTSVGYPFYTFYMDSKTDMLYTASEVGLGPSTFVKIGYNVLSPAPQVMNGFRLRMQNTTFTSLTGFTLAGWTEVYTGTFSITTTGLTWIYLTTPFVYTGSNLLIEICFNNSSYTSNSTVASTTNAGRVFHNHIDLPSGDGCQDITTGSAQAALPNICFVGPLVGVNNEHNKIPNEYSLSQNYPNPFNPSTIINYQLPMSNYVKLTIYDAIGRETAVLVNQKQNAGSYSVEWDGTNYSSGLYFYKLECEGFTDVKKMALIK